LIEFKTEEKPPVQIEQVMMVMKEALTETKDEFTMVEDSHSKRLKEDTYLDKFKLIEKFILFWIPRMNYQS
jgi:hypothetical protein